MKQFNNAAYIFLMAIAILFNKTSVHAQTNSTKKSLEELFNAAQETNNKTKKIQYLKDFVSIAKEVNKKNKIFAGYYLLASTYSNATKLIYLDSIIKATENTPIKNHPATAYNAKAIYFENHGLYKKAIDNYLLSYKFAQLENNETLINANIFALASLKRTIGEFKETKILFKKTLNYSKSKPNSYLNTIALISLSNISYELEEVDSATYYNKLGISKTLKNKDIKNYHHFAVNQGIVHYIKKEYEMALDSLLKHKPYFIKNKDSINLSYIHFYLGKIYQDKGDKKLATKNYKKIDSLLNLKINLTPKFRESYTYLIDKFKQEKDYKNQLFYIEKLLGFDSIVNSKTNYLSKTIFKEYDIPKLKQEKKNILKKMDDDHVLFTKTITLVGALLAIAILFLIYQSYKKKQYKKKFLEIIKNNQPKETANSNDIQSIDVPAVIIKEVLIQLKAFEDNLNFLSKKITLNSLAKDLNTNSNYLSKIINHYKNTSFSNYINNLKVEYIISEIKRNPVLKKYTIKAIANEAYFNNAESFSKAFYKLKGIKPSYFLKEFSNINSND